MSNVISSVFTLAWGKLGHCPVCTGKAFFAASLSWIIVLIFAAKRWETLTSISFIVSSCLSLLWLAHVVAYATKVYLAFNKGGKANSSISRRAVMRVFANALIGAVIGSMLPHAAFAGPTTIQCSCAGGKTTSGCCSSDSGNVCVCTDPQHPKIQCGQGSVYYGVCDH